MKGSAIVTALILIVIGTLIIGGYLLFISRENWMAKRINDSVKALYIAEAGLERKLYEIKKNGDYADIPITYFPDPGDTESYYKVSVVKKSEAYEVTSTGVYHLGIRKVRQNVRIFNIWDLAFFSGEHATGQLAGCMNTRGTVFVLGEESFIDTNENGVFDSGIDSDDNNDNIISHLSDTNYAIDASGDFYIGNNYDPLPSRSGIPSIFEEKIPDIYDPELEYDTLHAGLFVKYGKVNLGGNAQVGNGEQINGRMDLVNVPDGFGTPDQLSKVFVIEDGLLYDRSMFDEKIRFPNLNDRYTHPGTGVVYDYNPLYDYNNNIVGGRMKYFQDQGLKLTTKTPPTPGYTPIPENITTGDVIAPISNIDSEGNVNSFSVDSGGNIDIQGKIYIDGNLVLEKYQSDKTMNYTGMGTIALTGNLTINVNLYSSGLFPANIMGFITPQNINLGINTPPEIMGIFYAGGFGRVNKSTKMAGAFVAHQITLNQVPDIFQVKNIQDNLPPGMINIPPVVATYSWREVFD